MLLKSWLKNQHLDEKHFSGKVAIRNESWKERNFLLHGTFMSDQQLAAKNLADNKPPELQNTWHLFCLVKRTRTSYKRKEEEFFSAGSSTEKSRIPAG